MSGARGRLPIAVRGGPTSAERGGLPIATLAGLLSAALAAAASRPWGLGPLGLFCYVPAFIVIMSSRRPLLGAITAGLASLGVASVGYEATVGIFPGVYAVALMVSSLPFVGVGALAVRFVNSSAMSSVVPAWRSAIAPLALACLWTAAEFLPARPEILGVWSLPFGVIGYSQIDLPTARFASLSSVTAVSAFVLLVNASLATSLTLLAASSATPAARRRLPGLKRAVLAVTSPAICVMVLLTASLAAKADEPAAAESEAGASRPEESSMLNVRLVQPNLPDSVYVAAGSLPSVREWLVDHLLDLAAGGSADSSAAPTLTLLPEAAWPSVIEPSEAAALYASVGDLGPMLIGAATNGWSSVAHLNADGIILAAGNTGGGAVHGAAAPDRTNRPRNSNSVLSSDAGTITHLYDKRRLVPIAESRLQAGTVPVVVTIAGQKVAPLICYDVVFPSDARAAARAGAELLAVLTDDSFAARADVPRLHLRVARMRAIETGLPVALVSNTGPSAVIAADGDLIATTSPLEATTLAATLPAGRGVTPYLRFGDWVGAAATAIGLGVGALGVAGGGAPRA